MTRRFQEQATNAQPSGFVEFGADGAIKALDEQTPMPISPTFLARFRQAAALGAAGAHEDALKAYSAILAPFTDPHEPREVTAEFLATVELRKIYCLVALQRYEDAKALCEDQQMRETYVGQLETEGIYAYYFCYANILGALGQLPAMNQAMSAAIELALEPLKDLAKGEQAWKYRLQWEKTHQRWQDLLEQSKAAHQFGVTNSSIALQLLAGEATFHALRGLGRNEEAKRGAEKILQRYRAAAMPAKIHKWEQLLQSVQ